MKISAVNNQMHTARNRGKKIGTAVGALPGGIYVASKAKDYFLFMGNKVKVESLKASVNDKVVSMPIANLIKIGLPVAVVAAGALAGRLIGGLIGNIIDKHNAKKAPSKTPAVEITGIKGIVK